MSGEDKVGADAGQVEHDGVAVHDYDPVRPAPPRQRKKPAKAADAEGDE